jgi:hypothetical protein
MGAKVVIADVSDERSEALAREVGAGSLYVPTNCMEARAKREECVLPIVLDSPLFEYTRLLLSNRASTLSSRLRSVFRVPWEIDRRPD